MDGLDINAPDNFIKSNLTDDERTKSKPGQFANHFQLDGSNLCSTNSLYGDFKFEPFLNQNPWSKHRSLTSSPSLVKLNSERVESK